jgi:hypothetical protein
MPAFPPIIPIVITTPVFLAQTIASKYAGIPSVETVALAGSLTTHMADPKSDIDLYVYADEILPLPPRYEIASGNASSVDFNNTTWEAGDEWVDAESGIKVDVMFREKMWMREVLENMLVRHQAQTGYTTCFWHNVLNSQILFDRNGWFADLQLWANQPYPDGLREAIVAKNYPILADTQSSYVAQISKAIERGDVVSVNHRVTEFLASYFDVLFAINQQPHPGEKRLLAFIEKLCPVRPPNCMAQVQTLVAGVGRMGMEMPALTHTLATNLGKLL